MYAIASLLDPVSDQTVRGLWERFEQNCGLSGVRATPFPHFSWMGADSFLFEPVEQILAEIASQTDPFIVYTAGLGIFTGPQPVVYIALEKSEQLLQLSRKIWNSIRPFAVVPNGHYQPDRWVPHITLAYREFEAAGLGCAIADIAFQQIELEIMVDHIAVIYQTEGVAGLKSRFDFR
ncbi:MAG: 2'-5' RNA ligase family protein [Chloroflexi bacterium]|nr:2'-5' RNA ligase family protein [Chloroflexota bacterium]